MGVRSIIYVDGFNLYYGAIRGTSDKWLNLQRFFERLRPDDDIQAIRYFTALVDGPSRARQLVYLQALETCTKVQVILGRYKMKQVICKALACSFAGDRRFRVPEEKRTDVAIGITLLDDAYQNRAERFVIVSGDSDLVPALNVVKLRFPERELVVYVPSRSTIRGAAVELRSAADKQKTLPLDLVKRSQFPAEFPDGQGGLIRKPVTW